MKKGKKLYEGKAKIIYATDDKNLVIQYFKDDATAFNAEKKDVIDGKEVNSQEVFDVLLKDGKIKWIYITARPTLPD